MKIVYKKIKLGEASLRIVDKANEIIGNLEAQGYHPTLRQLYYQFVARDLIENKMSEYKRLGSIINDARLAGLISWNAVVDRTRNLESNPHWASPNDFLNVVTPQYKNDLWEKQPSRVEVWIEKDALVGVIENVCRRNDVAYFSCRGYTSQSEMWAAGTRLQRYIDKGQHVAIIHLGDHDPSGIDMSRDIEDRLTMFAGEPIEVNRIALNMAQIEKYGPPPNPAKLTDSRSSEYLKKFGKDSWELDALEPRVLETLIETTIHSYRNSALWEKAVKQQLKGRNKLQKIAKELEKKK